MKNDRLLKAAVNIVGGVVPRTVDAEDENDEDGEVADGVSKDGGLLGDGIAEAESAGVFNVDENKEHKPDKDDNEVGHGGFIGEERSVPKGARAERTEGSSE